MDKISPYPDSIFRWAHVVAGVLWIGILYFFNWVNSVFAPTLDKDTKPKVVPELLPRTLFWFRWGAAWTWITGLLLLFLVFYHYEASWTEVYDGAIPSHAMFGITLVALLVLTVVYDQLAKMFLKADIVAFAVGALLAGAVPILLKLGLGFGVRGTMIHLGAMFGTFMAFNVWMRIWPAQKKIISAIVAGEKPPEGAAPLAGLRSKHNTYMSVPLIFTMVNAHHTGWAATSEKGIGWQDFVPLGVIVIGWIFVQQMYALAKTEGPKKY